MEGSTFRLGPELGITVNVELDAFRFELGLEDGGHPLGNGLDEGRFLAQDPLAGFEFRQVEHVVEQLLQKDAASRIELEQIVRSVPSGVSPSKSAMPMMAFIGVRISWLIRA